MTEMTEKTGNEGKEIWSISENGDLAVIKSPYEPSIPRALKNLGGRWDPAEKVWAVPLRYKANVEKVLTETLGRNDEVWAYFRLDLDKAKVAKKQALWFGHQNIIRNTRDQAVKMIGTIAVLQGGFEWSGGSRQYPELNPKPGTIIEVRAPKSIVEKARQYGDAVTIMEE